MTKRRSSDQRKNRKRKARDQRKKTLAQRAQHTIMRGAIEKRQCVLNLEVGHPVRPDDGPIPIQAIIDTGATGVSIRRSIAQKMNLPNIGTTTVATVNGNISVPVVLLHITVCDNKNKHDRAHRVIQAMVANDHPDDMLFGMSAMEGGVLTVDTNKKQWEWRLTKTVQA